MRILVPAVLLLAAAAARAEGDQDKAYEFQIARARQLAMQAASSGNLHVGQEAFDSFLAASRIRPKDPSPLAEAGLLALDLGDGASAARMLAAIYEAAPQSGAFHFLRGCILQTRGEYADAVVEYLAAKEGEFRPSQAGDRLFECTVGRGLQLVEALKFDEALKVLGEAVEMRPNHPLVSTVYYNMATSYRRLQTPKEAERILRTSMERFPSYAPCYGELGDLLTELERFDEAVVVLEKAVKVDPSYARGWILQANTQTARGRFREADEAFREFEKRFPPDGDSEFFRGRYYHKKMEPENALAHLRKSLALDPSKIRCHYYISLCYRDLGMEEEAAEAMDRWKKAEEAQKKDHHERIGKAVQKVSGGGKGEGDAGRGGSDEGGGKDGKGGPEQGPGDRDRKKEEPPKEGAGS